jgi:hypothetical protein
MQNMQLIILFSSDHDEPSYLLVVVTVPGIAVRDKPPDRHHADYPGQSQAAGYASQAWCKVDDLRNTKVHPDPQLQLKLDTMPERPLNILAGNHLAIDDDQPSRSQSELHEPDSILPKFYEYP